MPPELTKDRPGDRGRLRMLANSAAEVLQELAGVRRQQRLHEPHPPASGLVLEVGGGQSPHPRANVTIDKYLVDNFERPGEADVDLSTPLVIADGHRIPFADGTFAYVIASHVLEHAEDPSRFAAELSRVGEAGFVQVPTRQAELTFGWPYHGWLIDRDGDCLTFVPRRDRKAPCGDLFHKHYAQDLLFRLWWAAHRSEWHHSVEWQVDLSVRVEGQGEPERSATLDVEQTVAALAALHERGALMPLPAALRNALRCPVCIAALVEDRGALVCGQCAASYPFVGAVPVLLEEAASVPSPA